MRLEQSRLRATASRHVTHSHIGPPSLSSAAFVLDGFSRAREALDEVVKASVQRASRSCRACEVREILRRDPQEREHAALFRHCGRVFDEADAAPVEDVTRQPDVGR